jgi:hypothetical protein
MRRGIEQRLMFVLAMELDEPARELLESTGSGERAVDERTAAPLHRDLSSDEQLLAATFEDRFDRRGVFARPYEVAGRAPAQQQTDRFDEDRLAGTGFAGQDVEARVEFDLDRIDHREVLNAQEAEHGNGENSNRNIGLTAISQNDTVLRIALSQRRTVLPRRPFAHAWKPDVRPAHPGDSRCCV